jgi:hypothetical protein
MFFTLWESAAICPRYTVLVQSRQQAVDHRTTQDSVVVSDQVVDHIRSFWWLSVLIPDGPTTQERV